MKLALALAICTLQALLFSSLTAIHFVRFVAGVQLFQRKFTREQGQGPNEGDCTGDIETNDAIGAGLSDSCAMCHGRPRGSAGVGGDVVTRPDSRDAPHLFGLGFGRCWPMK
jgi:hypothetical protein